VIAASREEPCNMACSANDSWKLERNAATTSRCRHSFWLQ